MRWVGARVAVWPFMDKAEKWRATMLPAAHGTVPVDLAINHSSGEAHRVGG
jgi:hypothetical protein